MKIATRPITTIVLLLFLMLPLGVAAAPFVYYDVNGDGEVNIADVNALVDRIIKGGGPGDDIPQPQESTGFLSAADYGAVGDGVGEQQALVLFHLVESPHPGVEHHGWLIVTPVEAEGGMATTVKPGVGDNVNHLRLERLVELAVMTTVASSERQDSDCYKNKITHH